MDHLTLNLPNPFSCDHEFAELKQAIEVQKYNVAFAFQKDNKKYSFTNDGVTF